METPRRMWWARPRKLCVLERPGGGGRTHRSERREAEIEYLAARGVRLVVSTMRTRHGLAEYDEAGLDWHHLPVPSTGEGADALDEVVALLRAELRTAGAVAVHGDLRTDFVAAVGAAHLHDARGVDPAEGLRAAAAAGLEVSAEAAALLGLDHAAVLPPGGVNPQTLSVAAGVALLAAAPALPGVVLFLLACYGLGSVLGQVASLVLGGRFPGIEEGRVAALFGLVGLAGGMVSIILGQVR